MQLSTISSPSPQALLPESLPNINRQGSFAEKGTPATSPGISATTPGAAKDAADGERVTLTAVGTAQRGMADLVPVYAEIWKGGAKVAEIDIHGGVTPVNGLVAASPGTVAGDGALLAARRAAEIVRSIGGEIRVGGQVMDSQTLDMRARLRQMYGTTA
ncbi:MAG: hypothetical protein WC100_11550 [Sterolibacterium sp.]